MLSKIAKLTLIIGFLVCLYFIYLTEFIGLCLGNCNTIYYLAGAIWFFIGIFLKSNILRLWAFVGLASIVYFVALEFIEGFCIYCTYIHLIGLTAIVLNFVSRR